MEITRTRSARTAWRAAVVAAALMLATVGFAPAAHAAPVSCSPSAITPARVDFGNGEIYVGAGGAYTCAKSVEIIRIHIDVYRDGALLLTTDQEARRRVNNKLLSLTVYQSPACVAGTYSVYVEGWSYVFGSLGFLQLNSHSSTSSPAVAITTC